MITSIGFPVATPDPDDHPALRTALEAIDGLTPDERFETFLRAHLDTAVR